MRFADLRQTLRGVLQYNAAFTSYNINFEILNNFEQQLYLSKKYENINKKPCCPLIVSSHKPKIMKII